MACAAVSKDETLTLTATDAAGNTTVTALPAVLALETAMPMPPNTGQLDLVVYRRVPLGSSTSPPRFEVQGGAGAVTGVGTVVVTAPTLGNLELGRGASDATGAFGPLALTQLDVAQVAVAYIDRAGNFSNAAPVHDTESGRRAWARSISGPHQLFTETVATARFTRNPTRPSRVPMPAFSSRLEPPGARTHSTSTATDTKSLRARCSSLLPGSAVLWRSTA